ncbi:hypothetical protein JGI23_01395 [Candidatus Chrysopegis kryptomonas]|uniref:Uncharacterized protein n=1 Tax=Candidatus Chryseopegocella kryptomonas TaxID=1633643 RepID=A0A0P1NWL3_9BACT|nr:hypothetical protein JGI23_01395 [Candidatus Chrysopegis kryptomonas]
MGLISYLDPEKDEIQGPWVRTTERKEKYVISFSHEKFQKVLEKKKNFKL